MYKSPCILFIYLFIIFCGIINELINRGWIKLFIFCYILWLIFGREFDGRSFIESGKFMRQEKGWIEIFPALRRKTESFPIASQKQNGWWAFAISIRFERVDRRYLPYYRYNPDEEFASIGCRRMRGTHVKQIPFFSSRPPDFARH